jgi:hypothetical protein
MRSLGKIFDYRGIVFDNRTLMEVKFKIQMKNGRLSTTGRHRLFKRIHYRWMTYKHDLVWATERKLG